MIEPDAPGMQERAIEPQPRRLVPSPAVPAVAQDGMAGRREVHADLVRAPGPRTRLEQGRAIEPLADLDLGGGGLACGGSGDDAAAAALERRLDDQVVVRQRAASERQVSPVHVVASELFRESA